MISVHPYYDGNDPEAPDVEQECASCLSTLTEDDPQPTCDGGDRCCLSCEAENEAAEIVLAEIRRDWTPTRTITERRRAWDVMEAVMKRAKARIDRDDLKPCCFLPASKGGCR